MVLRVFALCVGMEVLRSQALVHYSCEQWLWNRMSLWLWQPNFFKLAFAKGNGCRFGISGFALLGREKLVDVPPWP